MKKKAYSLEYVEKLRNAYVIEKRSTTDIAKNSIEIFGNSISAATIYNDIGELPLPKGRGFGLSNGHYWPSKSSFFPFHLNS